MATKNSVYSCVPDNVRRYVVDALKHVAGVRRRADRVPSVADQWSRGAVTANRTGTRRALAHLDALGNVPLPVCPSGVFPKTTLSVCEDGVCVRA